MTRTITQYKNNNLSFMGPLMDLMCSSLGFSHGLSWWHVVLCILDSTMFAFCSSRDFSLVSASASGLGSFLGDLSKLEFLCHSCTFPHRLHGTTTYRIFLLLSLCVPFKKYYSNTKEVPSLCQFSFVCWKALFSFLPPLPITCKQEETALNAFLLPTTIQL